MTTYKVYTDGSSLGNPGPGGYGVVLTHGEQTQEYSQGYQMTTNNRMELLATIVALEKIPNNVQVEIYSDSSYVVNAINQNWLENWQKKGWKTANKKPVKNKDLWLRLLQQIKTHQIKWHWVKGHAGHPQNERCDYLAVQAAQSGKLAIDKGFEQDAEDPINQLSLF
jgi:ribonuclease HI